MPDTERIIEAVGVEWYEPVGFSRPLTAALVALYEADDPEPMPRLSDFFGTESPEHTAWRKRQEIKKAIKEVLTRCS